MGSFWWWMFENLHLFHIICNKENLLFSHFLHNFRRECSGWNGMYIRVNSKRKVVDLAECYCIIANYMSRKKGLEKEFSFSSSFSGATRITLDPSANSKNDWWVVLESNLGRIARLGISNHFKMTMKMQRGNLGRIIYFCCFP